MNTVLNFFGRQHGNGFSALNDTALTRLSVGEQDSWDGITPAPSLPNFNPLWPISAAKFAKCKGKEHILAIANDCGQIALLNTNLRTNNRGGERPLVLEGKQCHRSGVFDIDWMPGSMNLVSASADRSARLFAVTESSLELIRTYNDHSQAVKTVAFRRTDPAVFATGGRDGVIALWDSRASCGLNMTPKADNFIYGGHTGGLGTPEFGKRQLPLDVYDRSTRCSITGLVFQDDNTLISCGAGDGIVKVWDVRRHYSSHKRDPLPKHSFPYAGTSFKGFTNLLIDHTRNWLYVNCMDNYIYCYNISGYPAVPIQRYSGLNNNSYFIKSCLSPDGQYLLSGSGDNNSYIWNVNNPNPLVRLEGHVVAGVAWMQSRKVTRIVTCSGVQCRCIPMIQIWRVGLEETDEDMKVQYKRHAKCCVNYWHESGKVRSKSLEFTPRSIGSLITDYIINKQLPLKRTFSDIDRDNLEDPLELALSHTALGKITKPNGEPSCSKHASSKYSPTVNLPNFALYGEAPHLVNVTNNTNKRKLKENADWLTRIRQQKLLQLQAAKTISIETSSTNETRSRSGAQEPVESATEPTGDVEFVSISAP
ncbi:protein lethal(2)denticleless-like [Ochlerotatus camptorhynchus]|uniref:protein lethal(2)denticleless-like n=1 Tax=Ochlerotatus camptorhynchus TaxID=644619 RepID=UPI0031CF829F